MVLLKKENLGETKPVSVVAAIADVNLLERLAAIPFEEHCDLLEFRLDAYPDSAVQLPSSIPSIITARSPDEGGLNGLSLNQRCALLTPLLSEAAIVDLEIASLPHCAETIQEARRQETEIVASFHDFSETPPDDELRSQIDAAIDLGADGAKLAVMLRTFDDLARLVHILEAEDRIPLSVMGMGKLGRLSRLALASHGSVLNYGYLEEANAPGQWPAKQLRELIRALDA